MGDPRTPYSEERGLRNSVGYFFFVFTTCRAEPVTHGDNAPGSDLVPGSELVKRREVFYKCRGRLHKARISAPETQLRCLRGGWARADSAHTLRGGFSPWGTCQQDASWYRQTGTCCCQHAAAFHTAALTERCTQRMGRRRIR